MLAQCGLAFLLKLLDVVDEASVTVDLASFHILSLLEFLLPLVSL